MAHIAQLGKGLQAAHRAIQHWLERQNLDDPVPHAAERLGDVGHLIADISHQFEVYRGISQIGGLRENPRLQVDQLPGPLGGQIEPGRLIVEPLANRHQ